MIDDAEPDGSGFSSLPEYETDTEQEETEDWIEFSYDGLDSCTSYKFFLNAVGQQDLAEISAETLCLDTTTTRYINKFTKKS